MSETNSYSSGHIQSDEDALQEIELAYLERQKRCEDALQECCSLGLSKESMAILEYETGLKAVKRPDYG